MFYLITISGAAIIIALSNFLADGIFTFFAIWNNLLIVALGIIAVFLVDAFFAFVTRRLPEKWFAPEARLFAVSKREVNFYRRTKINVWKKYVPEWGCFTGFHKDKMREPSDSAYIGRFLLESNYGVLGHVLGAFFGFLIMLLPFMDPISVALPIAAVNFVLSILPTMILRFNTPALRRIYRRNLEREKLTNDKSKANRDQS